MQNIHEIIAYEYDRMRENAQARLSEKKRKLYADIPELEEIESRIYHAGIKCGREILSGRIDPQSDPDGLFLSLENLKSQKRKILSEHGISPESLEPEYNCRRCGDTGYVKTKEGRLERCSCYMQKLIELSSERSNLNLTEYENFDTFDDGLYPDDIDYKKYGIRISPRRNVLKIRDICNHFIDNFDEVTEKNLFFSGPAGVGKTFMCSCIARELLHKGVTVLYQTAPELFNTITRYRMGNTGANGVEESIFRSIYESGLLIIDDLGTEPLTDARYSELLTILNQRMLTGLKKRCKTIISTNISIKELYEYYDERIASRIIGNFTMLKFAGDDLRARGG
jgi:DNA replication protein DnaC